MPYLKADFQRSKIMETAFNEEERGLSLLRLLLGFMEYANAQNVASFPPFLDPAWHRWLYELQKKHRADFYPHFECVRHFDWDGEEPTCRGFQVAMFGLRYVCHSRIAGGRVYLNKESFREQTDVAELYQNLMRAAFKIAHATPGFFDGTIE